MLGIHRSLRDTRLQSKLMSGCAITLAILGFCLPGVSQQVSYALLHPGAIEPVPVMKSAQLSAPREVGEKHHFWDRENTLLFAANAAFSAADFVVTRNNLNSGGQEFNPVTHMFGGGTAGLALNFTGETAGVVGLSYFLHRSGHHKLERAVSVVNLGGSAAAVGFGLSHR